MGKYYDGTKLLSLKDVNGNTPEIYICTSNRSGGKTTFINRLAVNRFLKNGTKFGLLYRYNYELDGCADKFFKEICKLFFPNMVMENKRRASGIFHELFLDGKSCGYAVSINSSDQIKKYSHLMADLGMLIFDEFQSETNKYCSDEITKFLSIHTSLARGNGEQVKYLPVYMLSNPVTMINPYYVEMGISNRLREDTNFLRGNGFVLENGFIQHASDMQKESAFNQVFKTNKYVAYASQNVYLNDSKAFIEKPSGGGKYIATLKYEDKNYAVREYADLGFLYIDDKSDSTYPTKITVTTADHEVNYVMLKRNDLFIKSLRFYFEKGCFRFKDLKCKEVILKALSY